RPIRNSHHRAFVHFGSAASNASQVGYGLDQQFVAGGRARTWGDDSSGQVSIPQSVGEVASIAGGLLHSLALRTDGTVTGWGNNGYGQTTNPAAVDIAANSAGGFHSLALLSDGTVTAWGRNDSGQTNV